MSGNVGMSSCCLSGAVHEGKLTGRVETIGGLQCYVSAPEDDSKAKSIVFLVDSEKSPSSTSAYTRLTPFAHKSSDGNLPIPAF